MTENRNPGLTERILSDRLKVLNLSKYQNQGLEIMRIGTISLASWLGIRGYKKQLFFKMPHWLDHCYFLIENKEKILVGEPYQISGSDLLEIIDFCEKYKLKFYSGWLHPPLHFPNNTLALCFSKNKEDHKYYFKELKNCKKNGCVVCGGIATRLHSNHGTGKVERVCEEHYVHNEKLGQSRSDEYG